MSHEAILLPKTRLEVEESQGGTTAKKYSVKQQPGRWQLNHSYIPHDIIVRFFTTWYLSCPGAHKTLKVGTIDVTTVLVVKFYIGGFSLQQWVQKMQNKW